MLKLLLTKCPGQSGWTGGGRAERALWSSGGHQVVLNKPVCFSFLRQSLTKKLKDWDVLTVPLLLSDRFEVSDRFHYVWLTPQGDSWFSASLED